MLDENILDFIISGHPCSFIYEYTFLAVRIQEHENTFFSRDQAGDMLGSEFIQP